MLCGCPPRLKASNAAAQRASASNLALFSACQSISHCKHSKADDPMRTYDRTIYRDKSPKAQGKLRSMLTLRSLGSKLRWNAPENAAQCG